MDMKKYFIFILKVINIHKCYWKQGILLVVNYSVYRSFS